MLAARRAAQRRRLARLLASTTLAVCGCADSSSDRSVAPSVDFERIEIHPTNPAIAAGTTCRFRATGVLADSSTLDVTGIVAWTSSEEDAAVFGTSFGSIGAARGIAPGVTSVVATIGSRSASTSLTVTDAEVVSIEVEPASASIALGTRLPFVATGVFTDATTQDLTADASWSTTDPSVAEVSNASGDEGAATGVGLGSASVVASFHGVAGAASLEVTDAVLVSIDVQPALPSIALGTEQAFTATGVYSDATTQDLTSQVAWTSSAHEVATVDDESPAAGRASSVAPGATTVAARLGGIEGSTVLLVTPAVLASIELAPQQPSIALGTTRAFVATGRYTDASTQDLTEVILWSSSDPAVAQVSNAGGSEGRATSVGVGTTTITATSGEVEGSTTLTVTEGTLVAIEVTPILPILAVGTTQQFTATGIYADLGTQDVTDSVTWSSLLPAVATISNAAGTEGLASAVGLGVTTITATSGPISGAAVLTATPATLVAITVTPPIASIASGTTEAFTATGIYSDLSTQDLTGSVSWSSALPAVATVSNAPGSEGVATGLTLGVTTVTATSGLVSGAAALTVTPATLVAITVNPPIASIASGTTEAFTATGLYSDLSTQDLTDSVTWSSLLPAVATVSNAPGSQGVATGSTLGVTTISATSGLVSGAAVLTVTPATLVAITVNPPIASIASGTTQAFTATGIYSDLSAQDLTDSVSWSSALPAVATVSNAPGSEGVATGLTLGVTTVSATSGLISGAAVLTVTPATLVAITVNPPIASIASGTTQAFTATGIYSDLSTQDLTDSVSWSSALPAVATVSNAPGSEGVATGLTLGVTTITATSGLISGAAVLTVTPATLVAISVDPPLPSIALGTSQPLTATGVYSDLSTQDLTGSVTWSSLLPAVATVSNAAGSEGLATAAGPGVTTITATSGLVAGTTVLTVTPALLVAIDVTPPIASIALGTTQPFTATGVYSDLSTQDLTGSVTWGSLLPAVATVSNAAGSEGLATSAGAGVTTITATSGLVSGSAVLTVSSATLLSISVTPALPSIALGTTRQFTATGLYSDASTQDLTDAVTWSSLLPGIATISNAAGSEGVATSAGVGLTSITATSGPVSGATVLTVTPAALVSIAITPADPSIALGTTRPFVATGSYSDGSTQDLTSAVTWSSSAPSVATISNAVGTRGLATSAGVGSTTITATSGAVVGSTSLTVTAATLVSISVTPVNPSSSIGTTRQFTASGTFSDGSTQDLTTSATWTSSNVLVATISNASGTQGRATALLLGTTTIMATSGGVSGVTTLTVTF